MKLAKLKCIKCGYKFETMILEKGEAEDRGILGKTDKMPETEMYGQCTPKYKLENLQFKTNLKNQQLKPAPPNRATHWGSLRSTSELFIGFRVYPRLHAKTLKSDAAQLALNYKESNLPRQEDRSDRKENNDGG